MPTVVDYPVVLADQQRAGLRSLYHNSGAFGFPNGVATKSVGWLGRPDPTLRPAAVPLARVVPPPFARTMAERLVLAWHATMPGDIWLMPKAHWAYELDFGSKDWLPGVLADAGVDAAQLAGRNNGSAVAFGMGEGGAATMLLDCLLRQLTGSDFAAAWPGRRVACTIHSHEQVWWTTDDADVMAGLDRLVPLEP